MSTIVTRAGKGAPLTNAELDANFTNLNTDKLEAGALSPYLLSASAASTYLPLAGGTLTGNLGLNGTGLRLTGDLSNNTVASRLAFQSSTANGQTFITALTNGTATTAGFAAYSSPDGLNTSVLTMRVNTAAGDARINSDKTGTGAYLPLTFYVNGSERGRIEITTGNWLIGGNTDDTVNKLQVTGTAAISGKATIEGLTVGRGAGAVSTNTAVGASALAANTTGATNTAIGNGALQANSTTSDHVAVGYQAGYSMTGASQSVFVGSGAGYSVTGGLQTAVGFQALYSETTGSLNTAVGHKALTLSNGATANAAFGRSALRSTTTGSYNTGLGTDALYNNTTASNNTAVGYQAGYSVTTSTQNTAFGAQALRSHTTGSSNTAIGYASQYSTTTASNNISIGDGSMYANTTGANNIGIGIEALRFNTTASNNTAVGYQAGYANTTGNVNVFVGGYAGYSTTTGVANTMVGYRAGYTNSTGQITALGYSALENSTTAIANTGVGTAALRQNTTGQYNTAVGDSALQLNTTASNNTAVGYQAGYSNTTGISNTNFGYQAGYLNQTGQYNAFFGYQAGYTSAAGASVNAFNTALGTQSGYGLTTGVKNTLVGYFAGGTITTGSSNTVVGGYNGNQGGLNITTSSNNIVLSDGDGNPQFVVNGSSQAGLFGQPFSGWDSTRYRSLQFGNGTSARYFSIAQQFTAACSGSLLWNAYGDGDNTFKYAVTGDKASRMVLASDYFAFYGAATGTAGNAISWSTILGGQKDYTISLQDASSSSGTGIAFPATQVPSSNANTLDDYEEGTWTPTNAGDATGTISEARATYVKVGRMVYIDCNFKVTANFTSNAIGGLPFTPSGTTTYTSISGGTVVFNSVATGLSVAVNFDTANLVFYTNANTNNTGGLTTTNDRFRLTLVYKASA